MSKASKIHAALLHVQRRLKPSERNRSAEDFTYSDLSAVLASCRSLLLDRGVLTIQSPDGEMQGGAFVAKLTTVLYHVASGNSIEGTAACPCRLDRQDYAATITVLRRVGLASIVGIVQAEESLGLKTAHEIVNEKREQNQYVPTPSRTEFFK